MKKSLFKIEKMDCPSEERLIRMKLEGNDAIRDLNFDLANRTLTVIHEGDVGDIEKSIAALNLGSSLQHSEMTEEQITPEPGNQRKLLWSVLAINVTFFIVEMTTGIVSRSMGLVADSLDMLADSFVYGLSLFAVGSTVSRKKKIATLAGYFQITLAIIGLLEILRRFFGFEQMPDFKTMIVVSLLALIANAFCLYLLQKSKSEDAHMKASVIFTSNDVIINIGVIVAATFVYYFESGWPDLMVGVVVFVLVLKGAFRILRLGR
jgi:Co/Zn/Cd efflux system component